ncbi:transglycosylase domain-containing protein, partial [Candidatus Peregrinibacteria bacterium]|nr:transglycosylase domain-containing protein [Candidatus Peregrinibacteria bacterium]
MHRFRLRFWLFGFTLAAVFFFLLFLNFWPISGLFEHAILPSAKIYDRNGILLYETLATGQGRTTELAFDQISKKLIQATIAVEDERFFEHGGIDARGILRAAWLNIKVGEVVSGGSTITQQLIRNVLGTKRARSPGQKLKETLLAVRAERALSKNKILELYLNKVYYGNLNYGAAAAAEGYFGKKAWDLDLAETAFLAGLPQAPNRYDPFEHREAALKRKDYVLLRMREEGFISDGEMLAAQAEKLAFERNLVTVRAPHFVNFVIEELENRFGETFTENGFEVRTTLDYSLQQKVQGIARRRIAELAGRNITNAGVIVLDARSGGIAAMLGSLDYFDESIDGQVNITIRPRQPGSAMKPITYALAFEKGWYGGTVIADEPVRFFTAEGTPYLPKNYDFEYHGRVTAREALGSSYNIPAIKAAAFVGAASLLEKARAFGLSTLTESADHYGLALTLGDAEVKLLDISGAYMSFANGGIKKPAFAIAEVRDRNGKILFTQPPVSGERVIPEDVSFMITDILADNGARMPEFGLNNVLQLEGGRPAAVKTGTTRNFRDNWTVGFTPD